MNGPLHAARLQSSLAAAVEELATVVADGQVTPAERARLTERFDEVQGWSRVVLTSQQLQQAMSRSTDPDRIAALAAALSYALASVG